MTPPERRKDAAEEWMCGCGDVYFAASKPECDVCHRCINCCWSRGCKENQHDAEVQAALSEDAKE